MNYDKHKNTYWCSKEEMITVQNFNKNMLAMFPEPKTCIDLYNLIILLGNTLLSQYMIESRDGTEYTTSKSNVKRVSSLYGTIVKVRHLLTHPCDVVSLKFALDSLRDGISKHEAPEDSLPIVETWIQSLQKVDWMLFKQFVSYLFRDNASEALNHNNPIPTSNKFKVGFSPIRTKSGETGKSGKSAKAILCQYIDPDGKYTAEQLSKRVQYLGTDYEIKYGRKFTLKELVDKLREEEKIF